MDFSNDNIKRTQDKFGNLAKNVNENDLREAISEGQSKIEVLSRHVPDPLKGVWDELITLYELVVDYVNNRYTDIPWNTVGAIVAALLYFISPVDVISDFIPVVGYLDDAFVIGLCVQWIRDDLEKYKRWKRNYS